MRRQNVARLRSTMSLLLFFAVCPPGILPAQTDVAATEEKLFSGPQPGEKVAPFKVLVIKDDEPREMEIVKRVEDGTTLVCFIHRMGTDDRILFGLGLVDFYARRFEKLKCHFVILSDERDKVSNMLRGWARGNIFPNAMVSLSTDGLEGPGFYGLNPTTTMTALVIKDGVVANNMVFNAPNNFDLEKIMIAVAEVQGAEKPSLAAVQKELRAERQRQLDLRIKASPVFKLAPNEELGRTMYWMANGRGNLSKNAQRRKQQLLDWVGDSADRKVKLRDYCKTILKENIKLNQFSLAAIQELSGD